MDRLAAMARSDALVTFVAMGQSMGLAGLVASVFAVYIRPKLRLADAPYARWRASSIG